MQRKRINQNPSSKSTTRLDGRKTRLLNKKPKPEVNIYVEEVESEYEELDWDDEVCEYEEEDLEKLELLNKMEIQEELKEYLAFRSEFVVVEFKDDFAIVAKFVNLTVRHIHNPDGFQPLERVTDERKCVLFVIEYGDEPTKGLAFKLKQGGCKVVQLNIANDVVKLNEV